MSIEIEETVLEKACKEMIETIFLCLSNAYKGTIYRVGNLPELRVEGITSGVIDDYRERIEWGLAGASDYNPPGKPWSLYRDEPDRPLEAMGWCVERQKGWTSEDSQNDSRSVRLQLESGVNEFQHMEPVLVRKADLNLDMYSSIIYPKNYSGHVIWSDSDYVVVAVLKIYFRPYTIRMNSHETRVIKRLSRSLGTELLSYQLRQDSMKAMQEVSRDRLNACNIIADSLRNAITKSGMIFTLAKKEIAYLREQWELMILEASGMENPRKKAIEKLDRLLSDISVKYEDAARELHLTHERLMELSLPPVQGEKWLRMQVEEKWGELLDLAGADFKIRGRVKEMIDEIIKTLGFGCSPEYTNSLRNLSEGLKEKWVNLIYKEIEGMKDPAIDLLLSTLENPEINIPGQEKSRKALLQLKALAETMGQLERNTNFLINQVLMANSGKGFRGNQYGHRGKKGQKAISVTESFIPV